MKRLSFDETREHTPAPQEARLECRKCGKPTQYATLEQYGAQCFSCYSTWCGQVRETPSHPTNAPRNADPLSWARRLRAREQAGERLSQFQRDAWREALRHEFDESERPIEAGV